VGGEEAGGEDPDGREEVSAYPLPSDNDRFTLAHARPPFVRPDAIDSLGRTGFAYLLGLLARS
jgi:hypothetical protein